MPHEPRQKASIMPRYSKDCVTFDNVEIGADSASGEAVRVKIDDEWHWFPYSQVEGTTRDPRSTGCDSITVTRWIAEKKNLL